MGHFPHYVTLPNIKWRLQIAKLLKLFPQERGKAIIMEAPGIDLPLLIGPHITSTWGGHLKWWNNKRVRFQSKADFWRCREKFITQN
jgi:hypothetical protein